MRKSDFTLPTLDDLFSTQAERDDAKLERVRHIRFHDLRHSCASLLLSNGVPLKHIQEWLGHSDFTTTANIYAHLDYKSKITSAQAMETGLALPEGGDFSSRWSLISAGENS